MAIFRFFLILFLTCRLDMLWAKDLILDQSFEQSPLAPYSAYYEDKNRDLSIKDILIRKKDSFTPIHQNTIHLGFSSSIFWLKFTLHNKSQETKKLFLSSLNPLGDYDLYWQDDNGKINALKLHRSLDPQKRPFPHNQAIFAIELKKSEKKTFYFRSNLRVYRIPLMLFDRGAFAKDQSVEKLSQGLFYGSMLVMFLYNLVLFYFIKNKSYLFYSIYVLATSLHFATESGISFLYIWREMPYFVDRGFNLFATCATASMSLFVYYLLQFDKYAPKIGKCLRLYSFAFILSIATTLMPNPFISTYFSYVYICLGVILSLGAGLHAALNGSVIGRYYLISSSLIFLGFFPYVLSLLGMIERSFIVSLSLKLGMVFEIVTLSMVLAARIRKLNRAIEVGEKRLIEMKEKTWASLWESSKHLAHELNNPLSIIYGSLSILQKKKAIDESLIERSLLKIEDSCARIHGVGALLKDLAMCSDILSESSVELSECVKENWYELSSSGPFDGRFRLDVAKGPLYVPYAAQVVDLLLKQIFGYVFSVLLRDKDSFVTISLEKMGQKCMLKVQVDSAKDVELVVNKSSKTSLVILPMLSTLVEPGGGELKKESSFGKVTFMLKLPLK